MFVLNFSVAFFFQLSPELHAGMKESVSSLLQHLERNLTQNIDWDDVSVYTGCSGYSLLYLHLADALSDRETFLKVEY